MTMAELDNDENTLPPSGEKREMDHNSDRADEVKRFKPSNDIKSEYVLKELPNLVSKCDDSEVPLPDPFVLPKHFKPDVTRALQSQRMNRSTNQSFISSVAAAMFTYKRYPSSDDYYNVARSIVDAYPFMKSPTGTPCVSHYYVHV